jgi:hypothetical protein
MLQIKMEEINRPIFFLHQYKITKYYFKLRQNISPVGRVSSQIAPYLTGPPRPLPPRSPPISPDLTVEILDFLIA